MVVEYPVSKNLDVKCGYGTQRRVSPALISELQLVSPIKPLNSRHSIEVLGKSVVPIRTSQRPRGGKTSGRSHGHSANLGTM